MWTELGSAGIFGPLVKFADEPDNMWQKTLDVNVTGAWILFRAGRMPICCQASGLVQSAFDVAEGAFG
jgi:hypothetical protein